MLPLLLVTTVTMVTILTRSLTVHSHDVMIAIAMMEYQIPHTKTLNSS